MLDKGLQDHNGANGKTGFEPAAPSLILPDLLQETLWNTPNFIGFVTNPSGMIERCSRAASDLLGYTAAELKQQKRLSDLADPEEIAARATAISTKLNIALPTGFETLVFSGLSDQSGSAASQHTTAYEMTFLHKDSSPIALRLTFTAVHDAFDQLIAYLCIGNDLREIKRSKAECYRLDQHLCDLQFYNRSLIESNTDAFMTTDQLGIIREINHEMEILTGRSRAELIGAQSIHHFTDPARAQAALNRVLLDGKVSNYELSVNTKDHKLTVVSYNASTFYDSNKQLMGVFIAARDITHRKEFERLMEKNNIELINAMEQADQANLAKSEFLSSMSHELRTPLNAVLGFAQLMASDVPPPTATQQMSIDQILQAGWYLLRLINEILDLAMIESGRITLSQETMSFTEVLLDCEAMISPQAQKRGIQMIFPAVEPVFYVHADRTRVKQVMINLLSNAIKYNRDSGSVTVSYVASAGHRVRVSVTDTGYGLTAKQLTQLFQPFNRLGQESSSKEGTGIGLVVTKQLIELMDGTMGVASQVGAGSEFWIELAAASAPSSDRTIEIEQGFSLAAKTGETSLKNQRSVLYVEDNAANMRLVAQLLTRYGDLVLLTATDGKTGVQMARAYLPELILMDINLPGINGFSALKLLRKDPATRHIPVLALSANAMPRDIEKGLEAGFLCYLTKPINIVEFMKALDLALAFIENAETAETATSAAVAATKETTGLIP